MYINLLDSSEYVERFENIKNYDSYKQTKKLIEKGRRVKNIVKKAGVPSGDECAFVKEYLLEIEEWKYGMEGDKCDSFYERHLNKNDASYMTTALSHLHKSVVRGESDAIALSHLNRLKGMGSVREGNDFSQARQKMASSVLRLLYPEKYGVVDWRIAAVINDDTGTNSQLRKKYDVIKVDEASKMFSFYREISKKVECETGCIILPGDIETILFELSLELYAVQNA
jgi:hypothetical protein